MSAIRRILTINLPVKQSAFLWGARKTGKSTYLKEAFPQSPVYDFLRTDLFLALTRNPALLREQILAQKGPALKHPIILDEVQKVPQVLDEVHWLIENEGLRFILCGSSARKLKRGHANLLGGRAWRYEMFPLVSAELKEFDLLRALNHGLIPDHYLRDDYQKSLQAYVQDYLKEEIFAEGLTRNIPAFSRFFEAMAFSHGQLTNYSNIARDCGVDYKTVREYYQILVDTFLGTRVEPFNRRQSRQVISQAAKFYLFDVGVAGFLTNRVLKEERGEEFGRAFEHFILMEILAYRSYRERDFEIRFWRTKSGLEVDFVLGKAEVALEVKSARRVDNKDLRSLAAFTDEFSPKKSLLVSNEKQQRLYGKIRILPWQNFLELLWGGKII
ncbi:MAG: AAA family ATPase [Candidatus Omnitrophota bacterium]|nr:AAA family ATPase [Candidatus Omnitrophota bacterium]